MAALAAGLGIGKLLGKRGRDNDADDPENNKPIVQGDGNEGTFRRPPQKRRAVKTALT